MTTLVWRVVGNCHAPAAFSGPGNGCEVGPGIGLQCAPLLRRTLLTSVLFFAFCAGHAVAIPPNTPITNTAVASFLSSGQNQSVDASDTITTDASAGNSPPTNITLAPAQVAENAPGAVIGTLSVVDLDPADSHTFVVADPRFEAVAGQLELATGVALDFETTATVTVNVTATDSTGASVTVPIVVVVLNQNESPTAIALSGSTVTPNTDGAPVGQLSVADPDAGDTHTFSVDDPRFEVVNDTLKLVAGASLPPGGSAAVLVTATDAGGLTHSQSFTITATGAGPGGSTIRILEFAPGAAGSTATDVGQSQCSASANPSGPFQNVATPTDLAGAPIPVPGAVQLHTTTAFKTGAAFFVEVDDADGNADAAVLDAVLVSLVTDAGDAELLRLLETGLDTGVFTGYTDSAPGTAVAYDCALGAGQQVTLTASYVDAQDPTDHVQARAAFDPLSRVFLASTGQVVDGARITLVDGAGAPAAVFGDDGVSTYPATVVSGTAVVDGGGTNYPVGTGQYRFPTVTSGTYQLQVVAPNRFGFPSSVADAALQALPGAPYALSGASRGTPFDVAATGPAWIDVPLDLLPLVPTTATLGLYALAPGSPNASAQYVGATECASGAGFVAAPPPLSGVGTVTVPGSLVIAASQVFGGTEPVFVVLTDPDQDRNPFAPDMIVLTGRAANGDTQVVRLTETAASSGVFSGYLQLSHVTPANQDCKLSAPPGTQFVVSYQDAFDTADTISAAAVVDPGSRVFSSATGSALDGATITLIDAATGLPAVGKVFADDGVTAFPPTVVSGASATDAAGGVADFATGMFRYPVVAEGAYRLQVAPPVSFVFPTLLQDAALQALPGGPFVLTAGSRGADFTVAAGVPLQVDVPLDPAAVDVLVSKQAGQDTAAIGDFVQYQVLVQNGDAAGTVSSGVLIDRLPKGFRYVADSTRINGIRATDPAIDKDGVTLRFALPLLQPNATVEVRYVTEIGAGAALGPSENQAHVTGLGVGNSNTAFATVTVREDLLASHATIIGQVVDGACDEGSSAGLAGVRVMLEDGTYAITDSAGKYHFEGITAKTHVVQVDLASIPDTHQVISCRADTRHAGTAFSQFVDVQGGTLWRADFHVAKKPPLSSEVTLRLDAAAAAAPRVDYRLSLSGGDIPLAAMTAVVMLPDELQYVPGSAFLDGTALPDPAGADDGALTFRLGATETAFARVLTLAATAAPGAASPPRAIVKALAMFEVAGKRLRTPVVTSNIALLGETVADNGTIAVAPADQGRANITVVEVTANRQIAARRPIVIPPLSDAKTPAFDAAWLAQQTAEPEIVWPTSTANPRIPATWIVVKHAPDQRVALAVGGRPVEALNFDGTEINAARGVAVTRFRNVPIEDGDNSIIATLIGPAGTTTVDANVHYSGAPVRAEFVPDHSHLIADGITSPVVAIRLLDRSGRALHPGMTGNFIVRPPYRQLAPTHALGQTLTQAPPSDTYVVRDDGLAYIELEPTNEAGRAQLEFKFDGYRAETIDARLTPSARDWVLVGFGEGTLGYDKISGNMEAAPDDDGINVDGRAAFYAKGRVRGEWLLTLAYDSDKEAQNTLGQQIDPNKYYTLYGDGTQQRYDAQTQHKLYVKLERPEFVALFGDFNTGLDRTELTRYSRRMDGARAEYDSGRVDIAAFAANSDQGFVRDQFQGDGTSGEYGLSHTNLVMNSEAVVIEVRDRFKTEVVLSQQTLTRYLDYTIDYDNGTLIFKHPVPSQDGGFNLVYIIVEYEVAAAGADEMVAGGRAGLRFGAGDSGVGVTHIHDGSAGEGGDLTGADFKWEVTPNNVVTMEVAQTDKDETNSANAYLAQIEHRSGDVAGRAYVREQEENFGLGQQSTTESGTRKFGAEGEYLISDNWRARLDVFQQTNLVADKDRKVAESLLSYLHGDLQVDGGFRAIREETVVGDQRNANELVLGATKTMADGRLKLTSAAEIQLDNSTKNVDYPTRILTGAEYNLGAGVSLITDQEVTFGDLRDTQNTRIGVKAQPWVNGDVLAAVGRRQGENGDRLFATTGLLQTWQFDENWRFDFGLDRVQTLSRDPQSEDPNALSYNPNVPPASGSVDDDFTAAYIGAGYTQEDWDATSRVEYHHGSIADKVNVLAGVSRQLDDGKVVSGSFAMRNQQQSDGTENNLSDLRFGAAWRPADSAWAFLNRLDLAFLEQNDDTFDSRTRKLVENMNANYAPGDRWQLALQLGLKYVLDDIDGEDYFSVTSLTGAEYRYNLNARWDVGVRGSALHSFEADTTSYSFGPSVGYNPYKNLWLSVGWNVTGFQDHDFTGADYTEQGPYLKVRFKVDQESVSEYLGYASFARDPPAVSPH